MGPQQRGSGLRLSAQLHEKFPDLDIHAVVAGIELPEDLPFHERSLGMPHPTEKPGETLSGGKIGGLEVENATKGLDGFGLTSR